MASKGISALRLAIKTAAKVPKTSVGYEHPAKKNNHCGMCTHFERPSACEIVIGPIYPEDWCERFARKSG